MPNNINIVKIQLLTINYWTCTKQTTFQTKKTNLCKFWLVPNNINNINIIKIQLLLTIELAQNRQHF